VFDQLTKEEKKARTVTLKIKYHDFKTITRRRTLEDFIHSSDEVFTVARDLLSRTDAGRIKIRLAGISLSNFNVTEQSEREQELPFSM
jgi:DNA polymerase-4